MRVREQLDGEPVGKITVARGISLGEAMNFTRDDK